MPDYDFELRRVAAEIKQAGAKLVCLQLPDGLKPAAAHLVNALEAATATKIVLWAGSCYGVCDLPSEETLARFGIDMLIQFGHTELPPARQASKQ